MSRLFVRNTLGLLLALAVGIAAVASVSGVSAGRTAPAAQVAAPRPLVPATGWSVVPSPNGPTGSSDLYGVAAVSATDAWAVGVTGPAAATQTLIEHWNGSAFTIVSSPSPGTTNALYGVTALAANDVWAVGGQAGGGGHRPLIEHWNGISWDVVPGAADSTTEDLRSVVALAANDVWAVGNGFSLGNSLAVIEHWNGLAWSVVPGSNPGLAAGLSGVAAAGPNQVWAVGEFFTAGRFVSQTLIERWDGSSWSVVPSPNAGGTGGSQLGGVAVVSSSDVWAVGAGGPQTLIEHWNGSSWSIVPSPAPGTSSQLFSVVALAANDAWAAGYYVTAGGVYQTMTEHWDGSAWNVVSSPNPGFYADLLYGIATLPQSGALLSVGADTNDGFIDRTLAMIYTEGPLATSTPTPNPVCCATSTPGGPPPPAPNLAIEPPERVSFLAARDGPVFDLEFAFWTHDLLAPGGTRNACSAIFLFNPCYGGGMLDALQTELGHTTVPWVGGSASSYAEGAWSHKLPPPPGDYWTDALLPELGVNQTMLSALVHAAANDYAAHWPPPRRPEIPQWTYANGGENNRLTDPALHSHHAILWAGKPGLSDLLAVWEMRDALIQAWGPVNPPYVTIAVLFGDGLHSPDGHTPLPPAWGAISATKGNLQTTISDLSASMNPSAQFLFYAADHGGSHTDPVQTPEPLPAHGSLQASFGLTPGDLLGMSGERVNGASLTITYAGSLDSDVAVAVSLNGRPLGYLQRATASTELSVPAALLGLQNQVLLQSANSAAITINSEAFSTGGIGIQTQPVVTPTPTACPLLFADVPLANPFYPYTRCLACRGIISGYQCGGPAEPCPGTYFRPANAVTRGQVAKVVVNAALITDTILTTQQTFEDVPNSNPFWLYVERLAGRGYISGYACGQVPAGPCVPPSNRPYYLAGNNVTRGQLAKIVANAATYGESPSGQLFQDLPSSNPFYPFVERVALHSVVSGYGCGQAPAGPCTGPGNLPYFAPGNAVTRGQTAKIIGNTFYPGCQTPGP